MSSSVIGWLQRSGGFLKGVDYQDSLREEMKSWEQNRSAIFCVFVPFEGYVVELKNVRAEKRKERWLKFVFH